LLYYFFNKGIDSPEVPAANSNLAVANRNDMSKYVKTSNLQIKVTTFFQQLGKNVQEPMPLGLNLFQNSQRKARACLEVSPREYSIDSTTNYRFTQKLLSYWWSISTLI
jgi:hypothetical protein